MEYAIHSKSEQGWWSNKQGWVFDVKQATRFSEKEKTEQTLVLSAADDAEWICVNYNYRD